MTDPSSGRLSPRSRLTPIELRLYVVALLAATYIVAWRAIALEAAPRELPAAQRPSLALPPGWRLAGRAEVLAAPTPRVVRAPAARPLRVRTRSS